MINTYFFELKKVLPILVIQKIHNEYSITILRKNLIFVLYYLKKQLNCQFSLLTSISGIDFLDTRYRFGVIYELLSLTYNLRLRVKIFLSEKSIIPSSVSVFLNANWWEREVWDMFGIFFIYHPDLRRILTDYGFEGHPLRKDFPIHGFVEVGYSEFKKQVHLEVLELSQNFRSFSFESPWK